MTARKGETGVLPGQGAFVRNSAFGVLAGVCTAVASFACGVIVARILGVSGTGSIAMALWLVFATVTLSDCGITGALARFLPIVRDDAARARAVTTWLLWAFWIAVAAGIALLALATGMFWPEALHLLPQAGAGEVVSFGLIACCFIVHMAFSFGYHFLRGTQRFGTIARVAMVGAVLQVICVLLGSMLFGKNGAMAGYIVGSLPMALVTFRLPLNGPVAQGPERSRMMRYSGTLWIAGLLSPLLWTRVDLILVERMGGIHAAGLFTAAASLSALLIQMCMMLCSAVLPHLSAAAPANRTAVSRTTLKAVLFILLPVVFGTVAIAPRLVPLVYGPDFGEAGVAAALLALATAGSVVTIALSNVLNALDKNGKLVTGGATGALLTIALGLLLIPAHGIVGAAVARLGAQWVVAGITLYQVNRLQPDTVTLDWFRPVVVAALWCGLAAATVLKLMPSDWGLAVAIPAGALAYLAVCRLIVTFDAADFHALRIAPDSRAGRAVTRLLSV